MLKINQVSISPLEKEENVKNAAARKIGVRPEELEECKILKKSVDARKKEDIRVVYNVAVQIREEEKILRRTDPAVCQQWKPKTPYRVEPLKIAPKERPVVVGLGPAGLFAGLILARAGACPLILERGQSVEDRKKTVEAFHEKGILDPESNIQFGEGGAGAFSDGKLTTGIKDPRCEFVLETLAEHGAPKEITWLARPHVGTDRLPGTVRNIRAEIERLGGQVLFSAKLEEIVLRGGHVESIRYRKNGSLVERKCSHLLLAVGHSAEDTQKMLFSCGMTMLQKPFSAGFRIEHPQEMINLAQYGKGPEREVLPPAEYHLSTHLKNGRGVYTFCMCPGGQVVGASSRPGGLCVNGMSPYARDGENANAAVLVDVRVEDFPDSHPLAGFLLQRMWEKKAFQLGGESYRAPSEKVGDFLRGRASGSLGSLVKPTCRPGVQAADLGEILPGELTASLRQGIVALEGQMKGFAHPEAVLTGVETRSSCPVRHVRGKGCETSLSGVWSCGEGAGCAGGIMSAAVDGIRGAEDLLNALRETLE